MTAPHRDEFDFDFIVIGSGFGGSVAAHRLTEKGYRVAVMEMGRRWEADDFPRTSWAIHRWFWRPKLGLRGFFNMRFFKHVTILHGCAVGGGSITFACTLLRPPDTIWDMGSWAGLSDWKAEMPRHYDSASRMLGVVPNSILGPADDLLKQAAGSLNLGHTFYRTSVSIFQPAEGDSGGKTVPDPFFGGEGRERTTCIACGGCMMGCRHGAKNSLDLNYLYLAEKHGARVYPETRVVDVCARNGVADGRDGYEVHTVCSTAWIRRNRRRFNCRGVVFSASSLGTMELLFHLKETGSLPAISDQLGRRVRTNSESLIGVRIPRSRQDLSQGVAIGSGLYIDQHTHIEAVRYPSGSDAMSLLATILTDGRPGPVRIALWIQNVAAALLRHPFKTLRLFQPWGWARESIILLCMQALEGHIDMRWGRPWFWPFTKSLVSRGDKVPTFIPQANQFAGHFARLTGGTAMSMLPEILFNVPGTAHCIGGCVIGDSRHTGVVDHRHRVYGYTNMYLCDGSVVAANLGVNPSLTITALAERAMSFIPAATETAWQDTAEDSRERAGNPGKTSSRDLLKNSTVPNWNRRKLSSMMSVRPVPKRNYDNGVLDVFIDGFIRPFIRRSTSGTAERGGSA
ncbi:MAG: GMC family oxidoreductase [Acidobacteriia bacterium]|nr:GMC family oxidoreductase [Terriglobia bacterium]